MPPSAGVPEHSLHPKQFLPATVTVPGQGGREAAARRPDARTSSKTSSPREYCRQSSVGTRTEKFESRHFQTSSYFYRINSIRQFFEHELHKSILGHGGRLQGQPSGSECWWPWPWPIGAGGHGGAESLPRSRSHVLKTIARRGAVLHGAGRELQEQRRLQPASRSLPSSEGTRSGRRWVPRASTYSGAPASPALLGRPVGCPAPQSLWEKTERFSGQQGVASRDTRRPEWEQCPFEPCSGHTRRRDPAAPLTCSAMIPKSPKQACCTKFRLSTRTQPAGRESGEAQGRCPR